MNREQQEMALWVAEYSASRLIYNPGRIAAAADAAVAEFRKRYPVEPTAPPAVWYDEPPFEKINKTNLCWVENIDSPQAVYWSDATNEWWVWVVDGAFPQPLNRRRVSPIAKPQEPTT